MPNSPVRVSIVVFPECDPSIIYGVFDTLWAAGRLWDTLHGRPAGEPLFEPRLVGAEAGPITLLTGVTIVLQDAVDSVDSVDVVFVPNAMVGSVDQLRSLDPRLLSWIKKMHGRGAHVYAACGGSLAIAAAGLLDGLEATTHWAYASIFQRAFPNVRVLADRILVQTGPGHTIVCCGGASSWQDLSLLLIARYAGTEEAIRLSELFL